MWHANKLTAVNFNNQFTNFDKTELYLFISVAPVWIFYWNLFLTVVRYQSEIPGYTIYGLHHLIACSSICDDQLQGPRRNNKVVVLVRGEGGVKPLRWRSSTMRRPAFLLWQQQEHRGHLPFEVWPLIILQTPHLFSSKAARPPRR